MGAKPEDVLLRSFSYSGRQITLSCEVEVGYDPADFARALINTDMFGEVIYRGFQRERFTITLTTKGGGTG
jgi:hypothetical protein